MRFLALILLVCSFGVRLLAAPDDPPAFSEDWSSGKIDPAKWYRLRKQWGGGNHGVVPENVKIGRDTVFGKEQNVLVCTAHGDRYRGPVTGQWKRKTRVGGVIVSKQHFASGRFEIVMKLPKPLPKGTVPAIWTYAYRVENAPKAKAGHFRDEQPLYNPWLQEYGRGICFYWSEIDFPEFGKGGRFDNAMYNIFTNKKHISKTFDTSRVLDGNYHTYATEWRTGLKPMPVLKDDQMIEAEGFWWVHDKAVSIRSYEGNPFKKVGPNQYQMYTGTVATHFIDGKKVGENDQWVPCMAAQLNLGVWLPDWAGPADWETADISFASIKIWQYNDPGDVKGFLTEDITNNF